MKLQQPTDESSDCGTVAAQKSYGVSPVGLPSTETTTETGRRRRLLTDGAGHQVEVLADPGGIAARTAFTYDARGLLRASAPPRSRRQLRGSVLGTSRSRAIGAQRQGWRLHHWNLVTPAGALGDAPGRRRSGAAAKPRR